MGFADQRGRARLDPSNPRAQAVCDSCGVWYLRSELVKDMEFSGASLVWSGFWVCPTCSDLPNAQLLSPILPGDPKPIAEPRPERRTSTFIAPGFTLFEMDLRPNDSAAVLAQIAVLSDGPISQFAALGSVAIVAPMRRQQIAQPNASRTWLAVYNPTTTPIIVSTGQADFSGDQSAVLLGAGQAMVGNQPIYQGALTAISYFGGVNLLVGEAPSSGPPIPVVFP
jgi:hypothetical protein